MTINIINCPACGTFLLDDTAECHSCGHILNADRATAPERNLLPTDQAVDDDMEVCSNCGESCRKGLVRCWNCGAFTRPEIEAMHRQRVESGSEEVDRNFDLPVLDATSITEADSRRHRHLATPEALLEALPVAREEGDGSDDFELSEDVQLSDIDEDAFDLADDIYLQSGGETGVEAPLPLDSSPSTEAIPSMPLAGGAESETETIPLLSPDALPSGDQDAATPIPSLEQSAAGSLAAAVPDSKPGLSPEDELLKIAAEEEAEISKVRKGQRTKDSFVVFCPQGHRIRVRERFRGKSGKCPRCASVFIVPRKQHPQPKKRTDVEISTIEGGDSKSNTGRYAKWLSDIHLHTIIPEKLKLKADSLANDFQPVDVGLGKDGIFVATLVAAAGLFGSAAKKKPAVRLAMLEYFTNPEASPEGATVAAKRIIARDACPQFVLVQPAPVGTESLFGDIPIFGTGRIAVRIPRSSDEKNSQYMSFSLSEFREFADALRTLCGVEGFSTNAEIPLTEQYDTHMCHYGGTPVLDLRQLEYYQKDGGFKLEVNGWRCSTCGIVVSEEARKKEKLGGENGKGIAKAKCPKCGQKFGSNPLLKLVETAAPAPHAAAETPASDTPT